MILGRRAMDVLKILRILGLAICIQFSPLICSALDVPGNWLESRTQGMAKAANKQVATLERAVATKQQEYMDSLRSQMSKQEEQKAAQDAATEDGIWDKIQHGVENIGISIQNFAKQAAVLLETKISEWANDIIRFIGEIIFQMTSKCIKTLLPCYVCAFNSPTLEKCMVTMDFKVSNNFSMGISCLFDSLLYRLPNNVLFKVRFNSV